MTKYDIIVLRKEILWDVENQSETSIMFGPCKRAMAENQRYSCFLRSYCYDVVVKLFSW